MSRFILPLIVIIALLALIAFAVTATGAAGFSQKIWLPYVSYDSAPAPTRTPTNTPTATFQVATLTPTDTPTLAPTATPTIPPSPTLSNDPVLVGAGDIASCPNIAGAEATAKLLDNIAGTVFTIGDDAYESGTAAEFADCYDPTWGRHKARTHPVPGNHEYGTAGAAGYFGYFGSAASPLDTNCVKSCKGYYSYDVGAWHIIVLNSEISTAATSAQVTWLKTDLAAHPNLCTLAMWHKPLFSTGPHGIEPSRLNFKPFWDVLYAAHADLVLNGHDHDYERFAPQEPNGLPDPANGIREFVVGTGGNFTYPFRLNIVPNSEVRRTGVHGVIKLTLHDSSYDWEFVPEAGETFTDTGSGDCH